MSKDYHPKPIDTDGVELSPELEALTEKLAEHIHDVWAIERIDQGWTFGESRNDEKKHHPCLISYGDLPENEKTFDRAVAMGTLKAILALDYSITPPAGSAR